MQHKSLSSSSPWVQLLPQFTSQWPQHRMYTLIPGVFLLVKSKHSKKLKVGCELNTKGPVMPTPVFEPQFL